MEKHFIRADRDDFHEAEQKPVIAYVEPAKPEHVEHLLSLPTAGMDNRSPWVWVRLRNGDLMLATFPQGETYLRYSDGEGVGHY